MAVDLSEPPERAQLSTLPVDILSSVSALLCDEDIYKLSLTCARLLYLARYDLFRRYTPPESPTQLKFPYRMPAIILLALAYSPIYPQHKYSQLHFTVQPELFLFPQHLSLLKNIVDRHFVDGLSDLVVDFNQQSAGHQFPAYFYVEVLQWYMLDLMLFCTKHKCYWPTIYHLNSYRRPLYRTDRPKPRSFFDAEEVRPPGIMFGISLRNTALLLKLKQAVAKVDSPNEYTISAEMQLDENVLLPFTRFVMRTSPLTSLTVTGQFGRRFFEALSTITVPSLETFVCAGHLPSFNTNEFSQMFFWEFMKNNASFLRVLKLYEFFYADRPSAPAWDPDEPVRCLRFGRRSLVAFPHLHTLSVSSEIGYWIFVNFFDIGMVKCPRNTVAGDGAHGRSIAGFLPSLQDVHISVSRANDIKFHWLNVAKMCKFLSRDATASAAAVAAPERDAMPPSPTWSTLFPSRRLAKKISPPQEAQPVSENWVTSLTVSYSRRCKSHLLEWLSSSSSSQILPAHLTRLSFEPFPKKKDEKGKDESDSPFPDLDALCGALERLPCLRKLEVGDMYVELLRREGWKSFVTLGKACPSLRLVLGCDGEHLMEFGNKKAFQG